MSDQSFKRKKPNQSLNQEYRESNQNNDPGHKSRLSFAIGMIVLACLVFIVIVVLIAQYDKHQRIHYTEPIIITTHESKSEDQPKDQPKDNVKPEKEPNTSDNAPNNNAKKNDAGNLEELIKRVKPSIVFIKTQRSNGGGEGSGFFISDDGYILTCYHVIDNARQILVRYLNSDGNYETTQAQLVWSQEDIDVALIRLQQSVNIKSIEIGDAESVIQGHQIIAIGFPLGSSLGVEPTVTTGIVSSLRQSGARSFFQISAPVNPGNSGGALVSVETGKVIGIVNAKIKQAEGIGFAIQITDNLKQTLARESGISF